MSAVHALAFDSNVQAGLRRYLGRLVADAGDTGLAGVLDALEPAIAALFRSTPAALHGDLVTEINLVAHEYGLGAEAAHLARRSHQAAAAARSRAG